jgi:hypothetical protein
MTEEPGLPDPNQQASFVERAKKHAADGEKGVSRRAFLFKVSIAINAAVVALIATPVVRYLLGPIRGKGGYHSWVALGKVDDYRPGETAVATYRNPFTDPWDGETANVAC